jgi:hypothetical protein
MHAALHFIWMFLVQVVLRGTDTDDWLDMAQLITQIANWYKHPRQTINLKHLKNLISLQNYIITDKKQYSFYIIIGKTLDIIFNGKLLIFPL